VAVLVCPALPRTNALPSIVYDPVRPQRNGSENLDAGKSHQAEVAATVEVAVGCHELSKLMYTFVEGVNSHDCR